MERRHGRLESYALRAIAGANSGYTVITTKAVYDLLKKMKGIAINWSNIPKPTENVTGKTMTGVVYDEYDAIKEKFLSEPHSYERFKREYECNWEAVDE